MNGHRKNFDLANKGVGCNIDLSCASRQGREGTISWDYFFVPKDLEFNCVGGNREFVSAAKSNFNFYASPVSFSDPGGGELPVEQACESESLAGQLAQVGSHSFANQHDLGSVENMYHFQTTLISFEAIDFILHRKDYLTTELCNDISFVLLISSLFEIHLERRVQHWVSFAS